MWVLFCFPLGFRAALRNFKQQFTRGSILGLFSGTAWKVLSWACLRDFLLKLNSPRSWLAEPPKAGYPLFSKVFVSWNASSLKCGWIFVSRMNSLALQNFSISWTLQKDSLLWQMWKSLKESPCRLSNHHHFWISSNYSLAINCISFYW